MYRLFFYLFLSIYWKFLESYHVLESSEQADFKTILAFRATFEGDVEGFTLLKVMLANTVYRMKMII